MNYLAFYNKRKNKFIGIESSEEHTEYTTNDAVPLLLTNAFEAQDVFNDIKSNYSRAFKAVFQDYKLVSVSLVINTTNEMQPC